MGLGFRGKGGVYGLRGGGRGLWFRVGDPPPQNSRPKLSAFLSTLRAQILKNFKILKFSSEIENLKRATHQTLFFVGNSGGQD